MITGEPHYARVCIVRLARSDVDTDVDELLPTAPPRNARLARRRPDGDKLSVVLSFLSTHVAEIRPACSEVAEGRFPMGLG